MTVIEIHTAESSRYKVTINANVATDSLTVQAIELMVRDTQNNVLGIAEFSIEKPWVLPPELIVGTKLMSWSEIQSSLLSLRSEGKAAKVAEMEEARDRLLKTLTDCSINLGAGASGFLGVSGVGFASATVEARLWVDLRLLDPKLSPQPAEDVVIFKATLNSQGEVNIAGGMCRAAMRLEVVVTRAGLISLLPSFAVDAANGTKLPAFDFRWPKVEWPTLNWGDLDLGSLMSVLRFDLPIPKVGELDQPLHVEWTTAPQIKFTVAEYGLLVIATEQPGQGMLVCDRQNTAGATQNIAAIKDFSIALDKGGGLTIAGSIEPGGQVIELPGKTVNSPDALPFTIEIDPGRLTIDIDAKFSLPQAAGVKIGASLDLPRVIIRAKSDPALLLALHVTYEQTYDSTSGESHGKLTTLDIIDPYPVALVALAARELDDAAQGLIRLIGAIRIPSPGAPDTGLLAVLERICAMAGAAVKWLLSQASAAIDTLLGIAETIGQCLEQAIRWLHDALTKGPGLDDPHLSIEVRLDSSNFALRQILISPAWKTTLNDVFTSNTAGIEVSIPLDWRPSLLIDFDGPVSVALIALQGDNQALKLGTDLWLSNDDRLESVRDTDKQGKRPQQRLIEISVTPQSANPLVLFRFCAGKVRFFEKMVAQVKDTRVLGNPVSLASLSGPVRYEDADWNNLEVTVLLAPGAEKRLLPFLQSSKADSKSSPAGSTPSFLDNLDQYIEIEAGKPTGASNGKVTLPLDATLNIAGTRLQFPLNIDLDLNTFAVQFKTPENIAIMGDPAKNQFDVFGLTGEIVNTKFPQATDPFPFYRLDFSKGDVRLSLADGARLNLAYGKVSSSGRGIVFRVDDLSLSRSGLDLSAKVDPDTPVQLAGVNMPFRFDNGGLSIKNSEIQAFSIKGSGQLPPELVGEADATVSISMGRGKDGGLIVQSAEATLDKSNNPVVCHGTCFTLTLSAIGFQFQDFSSEGAGYHFYFTLSGTAKFTPPEGEFIDGLLKNFADLTITLDKAPLARDASMLLRAMDFQVAVEPKKQINLFNLFTFELRGIGFHPASPAFDGKPAMSISGQVNFVQAGDIVSPRFDFHKLWIAPPKDDDWRPQVRFDGLTVGIRFGGSASIEGTAIAVDDKLPTLFKAGALPANVTAKGFLASGKLTIKGWGQMAASMGFLELRKPDGEVRQAFFLYGQAGELSIEIPTPLGPVYLREVGFGFGYRYTLAAFNRADQVHNVKELIEVLDEISKYQGELASVTAWEPEAEGNRLTLALRGLISISSVSGETDYNAQGEKELSNPLLFDIVAALRSDLTFFMNARGWVSRNYADWHDSSATADPWRTNPTLRGYVYLSVPRKEFLGRLVADGTGDVAGMHPQLPGPLVEAMKSVRWSATTYIRPGLFHQEFGWPYELGFKFEHGNDFQIACQGGLVNRIEDMAFLYGIAFRAKGFAQIGGSVGGRSFGASVVARADFSIDAKFIAYLSLKRFNDTLFYGALAFDVSISLQVRAWLEFSVGPVDVRLEVGFSMSLTLSIALEVAVSPERLGGRACASVGVGAFGRTIRLGVGFGFNEKMLESARSRTERFLSLGLTVAMPDAEQGVAPLAPEQPRGPASRNADQIIDQALDKHDGVSRPEGVPHTPIRPSGYWAMLFPVAGEADKDDAERFIMILVPRDHSFTGLEEIELPRRGDDGEPLGTFYAPPRGYDEAAGKLPSLTIEMGLMDAKVEVERLRSGTQTLEYFGDADKPLTVCYDVTHPTVRSGQETLNLGHFLGQCFVRTDVGLCEPITRTFGAAERLPQSREAAAQVLNEAGRDQLALNAAQRQANDIEELRSSVIAALCESAASLAAGGEAAWKTEYPDPGLDVRALDIAFVIRKSDLDKLFDYQNTDSELPRPALFKLISVNSIDQPVHLFNAPERMFRQRRPKLADPVVEGMPTGIRLNWDLEPAFGASGGVWRDPEFNLKHYRIERRVMDSATTVAAHPPRCVTVKAAAPIRLVRDPNSGEFVWRFLRPNAQFIDDLSDLPPDDRDAILTGRGPRRTIHSVRYVVVPVDTAGTSGAPTPLCFELKQTVNPREGVRRAVLHFEYTGDNGQIRGIDAAQPARPAVMLGLDDGKDPKASKDIGRATPWPEKDGDRVYVLRVRKERSVPTGLYGGDAVSDALVRPSAGDFAVQRITDIDIRLTLAKVRPGAEGKMLPGFDRALPLGISDGGYQLSRADSEQFFQAIGVSNPCAENGVHGVRFAIRPLHDTERGETPAPWCPVDITLMINPQSELDQDPDAPPVAAPVEIFEHPVSIDAAPLLFDDLEGEGGRVLVWHPCKKGLLADLLAPSTKDSSLVLLRDAARRVATRVRWNARPAVADGTANKHCAQHLAQLFGGYDLFEVDAGGEAEGTNTAAVAFKLSYRFSTSTVEANPGSGMLRLNKAKQPLASALYVDLISYGDKLDQFDQSPERVKGHLRLVKQGDPTRWIAFDLLATITLQGYRKLVLVRVDASTSKPFSDNDRVDMLFTRLPARHVARVQALPAAMARLDPAEIADFAKVEAHYPSEARRLQHKGAGRKGAWYSPAESYVVWPQPTLRRALSINVDESILTELLSSGRPTHIEVSLKVGQKEYPVSRFGNHDEQGLFTLPKGPGAARHLRALLQALTWNDQDKKVQADFAVNPIEFRNASITVTARRITDNEVAPGKSLASAQYQVDLNPPLHPVLADAIDWVRYQAMPGSGVRRLIIQSQRTLDATLDTAMLKKCTAVTFALEGWPKLSVPPVLQLTGADRNRESLRLEFSSRVREAKTQFKTLNATIDQLTTCFNSNARQQLKEDLSKNPDYFADVQLALYCEFEQGDKQRYEFAVYVSSIFSDLDVSTYRRYEPVLEPLPKSSAKDFATWFNESSAERDPFGWGVLRTLGLAAGLRLYDTETRDYLSPRETLKRLNEALNKTLTWYPGLNLGVPFVDIVTRAGGTMKLTSFDGGTPATTGSDVDEVIDNDALALTQISLRPLVDRWSTEPGTQRAPDKVVAYFAIQKACKSLNQLTIDLAHIALPSVVAVADVLDLTTRLAKPPSVILAAPLLLEPYPGKQQTAEELREVLAEQAGDQSMLTLNVSHAEIGEVVALVRVIVAEQDASSVFGTRWVYGDVPGQGYAEVKVKEIKTPMRRGIEPFGRFGDLSLERYAALASWHPGLMAANARLIHYAKRSWPEGWPSAEAERALLPRIAQWSHRFMEHTTAQPPSLAVYFSLAEVTRPDPWRVGVQEDGTLQVLFTHDDRKRRLKRYAVKPFGRYESFVEALRTANPDSRPREPQLTGAWTDGGVDLNDIWSGRLLDIVIPRTEPVATPVLVDARRLEIQTAGKPDRRVLEFIYKRHTEEILSQANVTVEGALSFETVSVGFWREFGQQRWANYLLPAIDTTAAFGGWGHRPVPSTLIGGDDHFGGLAEQPGRYTDGWQGVLALRTEALPFFFRIHAAAFASAGVVVSDPVVATVEEGHYELHLPWQQAILDGMQKTPGPLWSVQRLAGTDNSRGGVFVTFQLPLIRFVDEMPLDYRELWLSGESVPQVFTLPDPKARYEIRTVANDAAGLSSVSSELDVIGELPVTDGVAEPLTCYRMNAVGPLFSGGMLEVARPARCSDTDAGTWWQLGVAAQLSRHEALAAESFQPKIVPLALTLFELQADAFATDAIWTLLAPQTEVKVTVTPSLNDLQFKLDVKRWQDEFKNYRSDPAALVIYNFLQEWLDYTTGNPPPNTERTVQKFTWGLPRIAAGRPNVVEITHNTIGEWRMPADAGIAQRERLSTIQTAPGSDQGTFNTDICAPLRREMRRLTALRKQSARGNRFQDFPSSASALPQELAAAALRVGMARGASPDTRLLPDSIDIIVAVHIEAARANRTALIDLISAVEDARFTATAITDLGALEEGGDSALVHLPCDALVNDAVLRALADIGARDQSSWRVVSLLLRMPPLDEERVTIMNAIESQVTDQTVREALSYFADHAMSGQVFGQDRKPTLKVFRGTAEPATDEISRATGGTRSCQ